MSMGVKSVIPHNKKKMARRSMNVIVLLLVIVLLAACSTSGERTGASSAEKPSAASTDSKDAAAGGAVSVPTADGSKGKAAASVDRRPAASPGPAKQVQSGQLTAGEWNDLGAWDRWLSLLNQKEYSQYSKHWRMYPQQRLTVTVRSGQSPVGDAVVTLYSGSKQEKVWQSRTNQRGEAELFVGAFAAKPKEEYLLTVDSGKSTKSVEQLQLEYRTEVAVDIEQAPSPSDKLDIMLVVDTTGSMGDELQYLTAELANVVSRVKEMNENRLDTRISTNFYRDRGDEYVIRPFPFTADIGEAVGNLQRQAAMGGGDTEEAVEEALDNALKKHQWSDKAKARLLFLVLDAPPHHTDAIVQKMQKLTARAAEMGVRIIPVASSGVDKNTEFLMRFIAVFTGGTYTFLTNHSGIGGEHIAPTVGDYKVEFLNDLMVRIINDYVK